MNALFLALLLGGLLYFLWQWDVRSRRRRAALRSGSARQASRPLPARTSMSTWLARIALGAVAAWVIFLAITLFRSAT